MRRIWNRPDFSVWSLSTRDSSGQGNFNICTYVASISMQPKLMMVAIYHHTKTLENVQQNPTAVLQLLTENHSDIIKVCGKQSGRSVDKLKAVAKKHPLMTVASLACLEDCAGYMVVEFVDLLEVGGDHVLAVAKVLESKNLSDEALLTTDWLKAQKIIR